MPLETATYISDLVTSNPAASDPLNNADDHIRLIKSAVKTTLAHTGALTNSSGQLIPAAGSGAAPAYSFAAEPTLGFYRSAPGVVTFLGSMSPNGILPAGATFMFLAAPANLGTAGTHTGRDYLELNGATYNVSDYPRLASFLGYASGTFTLPDMYSTGRFPRSRRAASAAGNTEANTVGSHVHPSQVFTTGGVSADHTHGFSGTTGTDSPDHSHGTTLGVNNGAAGGSTFVGYSSYAVVGVGSTSSSNVVQSGGASARHAHSFSGSTGGISADHTHNVTVSVAANTGTTETRPEAISFVFAIKT